MSVNMKKIKEKQPKLSHKKVFSAAVKEWNKQKKAS